MKNNSAVRKEQRRVKAIERLIAQKERELLNLKDSLVKEKMSPYPDTYYLNYFRNAIATLENDINLMLIRTGKSKKY